MTPKTFRRSWTAAITLLTYVTGMVAPGLAMAQDADDSAPGEMRPMSDYERVGGGSLSSGRDRAAAQTGEGAEVQASTGEGYQEVRRERASGEETGSEESTAGESDEGAPPNESRAGDSDATQSLGLPSGADKSGVTSQTISIPKGAGSIKGMEESFSAQLSTGIATFSVPFALMQARGGVSPSLGLSYSSAGGSGPAGQGWSVGVPFISRQTDRGLPKYLDGCNSQTAPGYDCEHANSWHPEQDRFVFNGGQELVPICTVQGGACAGAIAGEVMPDWAEGYQYFRPRVEGSFLRFFWAPDHLSWIVQDKSGTIMEIGVVGSNGPAPGGLKLAGTRALERNPDKTSEIYRWHLSRQYDQHIEGGVPLNLVAYDYFQEGGQSYLSDIYDTSPAAEPTSTDVGSFAHHTHLRWEARPDVTDSYRSGWEMSSTQRLIGVDVASKTYQQGVSGERSQVRRYHLSYDEELHRTLLVQVQVEGRCGASEGDPATPRETSGQLPEVTGCGLLPPMKFDYSRVEGYQPDGEKDASKLAGYMSFDGRVSTLAGSPDHSIDEALTDFYDINSDGLPDVLVTAPGLYDNGHAVFFNGEGGNWGYPSQPTNMGVEGVEGANAGTITLKNLNVSPQDLDGDGRINLVHMPKFKTYSIYDPRQVNGIWNWYGHNVTTASGQNVKIDFGKDTQDTQAMDVNFDGLVDVVVSTGTEYQTFFALGRYPGGEGQFGSATYTGATSATIDNNPVTTCVPHSALPVRLSDPDVKLADMNGDGIGDIVRLRRGDIQYWPGRGNGFWGTGARDDCEAGTFGADRYKEMAAAPQFSDIEGSTLRLNDVNGDGLTDLVQIRFDAVDIWLNVDGKSWTKRHILDGTPYHAGFHQRVRLIDINGSGTSDILWGDAEAYKYIDLQGGEKPYILTKVSNGLGKTTELEYSTSAAEMIAAAATGNACGAAPDSDRFASAWCTTMPVATHVVKRVTEFDNITIRGRPPAAYVTEYEYRDPVYEGRQREFRGFARARARRLGDSNSPTDVSESVFLLGECRSSVDGTVWDGVSQSHECAPPFRYRDNRFEALKGLPVETHKMDAGGVHLASTENEYTIRTLYSGLDGREVRHAFLSSTDSLLYDTAQANPGRSGIARYGFYDEDLGAGAEWMLEAPAELPYSAQASSLELAVAQLRSSSDVDLFGNKTSSVNEGCVGGAECVDDETITQSSEPVLLSHGGGWMWRTNHSYVVGSVHTARRSESLTEFDGLGRPVASQAVLSGTAAGTLQRTEAGSVRSGGAVDDTFVTSRTAYNSLGQAVRSRGVNGRCAEVGYDEHYSLFAASESISTSGDTTSDLESTGASVACPGEPGDGRLETTASYDHGLGAVTLAQDLNYRNTLAVYDEFGRITKLHKPSASKNGGGATYQDLPSVEIEYFLPEADSGISHSLIHTRTQDGASETDGEEWMESWAYVDGFGRTLVTLSEADPSTGEGQGNDGGGWVVGSLIEWDQKSAVAKKYMPFFWDGDPQSFDYSGQPSTEYGRQRYDAFGRQVQTFDLDGTITLQSRYHALGTDLWDAADLTPGQHQHSYASEKKDGHGRTIQTTERFRGHGAMEERHVRTEYLPTGEPISLTRVRGTEKVKRWMRYDSLGRMLLNVDAHTSVVSEADLETPPADASGIKAWRYQYNLAGDLIGTSDARGCGQNFYYDGAGRILGEDYAPCEAHQEEYSNPGDPASPDSEKFEVAYFYDKTANLGETYLGLAPTDWVNSAQYTSGRAIAVFDRGSASFTSFDGRGRTPKVYTKLAKPIELDENGKAIAVDPENQYAPRVYSRSMSFDAADREVEASTGVAELRNRDGLPLAPELLNQDGASVCTTSYSRRGAVKAAGSSYGSLIEKITRTADNLVTGIQYGDIAKTATAYLYDERRRISSVQTYRGPPQSGGWDASREHLTNYDGETEPTRQMVLQDEDFIYDVVGNPVEIRDWRDPAEWPEGAKPVTKKIEYDDLYRATRIKYEYAAGDDTWKSPFAAELGDTSSSETNARRAKPSPHVQFDQRILEQTFEYDWVGNNAKTGDDANGFYDRSLGVVDSDDEAGKPYQLKSASLPGARGGSLEARYDVAGNMTAMAVQREGTCLGGDCNQQFVYDWDEVGRLTRARRWDGNEDAVDDFGALDSDQSGDPAADLRYIYDASDQRVIKEAVDEQEQKSYTLYVFPTLELRRTQYGEGFDSTAVDVVDYEANYLTVSPYLLANGVRLARIVYHGEDLAPLEEGSAAEAASAINASSGTLHVFFELGDHLGSTSVVLDKATGELVERATFQGYGGAESDYRPGRWNSFREDYRFTGKEEDVEVGLQYFGKRYLNPLLGRWVSADPLAVHAPGEADLNLYAYVSGSVLKNVDPLGLDGEPSEAALAFRTDVRKGHLDSAAKNLNGLNMGDMLSELSQISSEQRASLEVVVGAGSATSAAVNGERLLYAISVVDTKTLPMSAPAGLKDSGQISEAARYIGTYLQATIIGRTPGRDYSRDIGAILEVLNDRGVSDRSYISYVLAAAWGESRLGEHMVEIGNSICKNYSGGCAYKGRGYVQLTHDYGYESVGQRYGVDLKNNPDLATQRSMAAQILVDGMLTYGFRSPRLVLPKYGSDGTFDWSGARAIVNTVELRFENAQRKKGNTSAADRILHERTVVGPYMGRVAERFRGVMER